MIILWGSSKFGKSKHIVCYTFSAGGYGSASWVPKTPLPPRVPITTDDLSPTWHKYFRELYAFLKEHVENEQVHRPR